MTPPRAPGRDCPIEHGDDERVRLAHGGGGRAMSRLIEQVFLPAFANELLGRRHDGAVMEVAGLRLAMSTDAYVVDPPFFPGGDIGSLAVNGTVNDLAMCGARAVWLGASFILEEGFPLESLTRVTASMADAARAAGAQLVTGDTKVVPRGKADGIFVTTTGVGLVEATAEISPASVRTGDIVILSGDLGRHGIAVMAARGTLGIRSAVESDCAALAEPVLALIGSGCRVSCLRDLTRGGLASALVEISEASGREIGIDEAAIPVCDEVTAMCELLGLDPLHVANEGRFVAFVNAEDADRALAVLRGHPVSAGAHVIGTVGNAGGSGVVLRTLVGGQRMVDMLSGEQLPRIC
ncbi:MAG: hydrogenase expression/formation protein HypE [Betaproteobacteria bacterium]|nr:hydrogenase expression/formation protein HypE [Betaproteobacteria bacterium]